MNSFSKINSFALIILLAALAVPLAGGAWYTVQKHKGAESKLAEIDPKYARLLGLDANAEQLEKAMQQGQDLIVLHTYPSKQDVSQVGNAAQQRLRELFTAGGMDVVSSQILPTKPSQPFEKIALSLRVEGTLTGFQSAMVALSAATPTIWVDGFTVQTMSNPMASPYLPQRLTVMLNVYVLRVK